MGLMSDIQSEVAKTRPTSVCRVRRAMSTMTKDEQADLDAALADKTIPATIINKVLISRGFELDRKAEHVQAHRRGACDCAR